MFQSSGAILQLFLSSGLTQIDTTISLDNGAYWILTTVYGTPGASTFYIDNVSLECVTSVNLNGDNVNISSKEH